MQTKTEGLEWETVHPCGGEVYVQREQDKRWKNAGLIQINDHTIELERQSYLRTLKGRDKYTIA